MIKCVRFGRGANKWAHYKALQTFDQIKDKYWFLSLRLNLCFLPS